MADPSVDSAASAAGAGAAAPAAASTSAASSSTTAPLAADERTALLSRDGAASPSAHEIYAEDMVSSPAQYRSPPLPDAQRPRSSYIIVTAPTSDNNRIALLDTVPTRHAMAAQLPPPRFRLLLPLLALVDLFVSFTLCGTAYEKYSHPDLDRDGAQEAALAAQRLSISLLACAVFRAVVFAGVGISKYTRYMGVVVAATSLLSTLFVMSVANMLLEAHALRSNASSLPPAISPAVLLFPNASLGLIKVPEFPVPILPLFTGQQLLFTVLEWATFIAVVGVRLPPGRNPVKARRWARTLQQHHGEGLDTRSLIEHHEEDDEDNDSASEEEDGDVSPYEDNEGEQTTISSSIRPIPPQSPPFPLGSPSPAPSLNTAQGSSLPPVDISPLPSSSMHDDLPQIPAELAADLEQQIAASQVTMPLALTNPGGPEDDDDDDGQDPQDIIDIPSDKRLSRQESRRRLAKAYARSNASSSSINVLSGSTSSSNRRSFTGNRRDSSISIRSTSTATGMGLPISTPSIPDRRISTNFRAQSPTLAMAPSSSTVPTSPTQRGRAPPSAAQGLLKGKSGKLGIGLGLGRRPSWLGGSKRDTSGSGSGSPRPS
ncbi:hypothetical protein OC835_001883 [Tilletia horrida]|nr:hypothetical protein OC835_001883 [Tilletia horrida]